jgi:hypothetical protein
VTLDREIAGTSFTDTNALMDAAVTGQGIALGRLSFARSDILAGRLVRLSEQSLRKHDRRRTRVAYSHYASVLAADAAASVVAAAAAAGLASGLVAAGSVAAGSGSVVARVALVAAHPGERAARAKSHDLTAGSPRNLLSCD